MRVAIIGNSGSGKSSLAQAIARETDCRVLDLDTVAWEPQGDCMLRPVEEALAAVRDFCGLTNDWIIEGCYANLVAATFPLQPKLIFLNPGVQICSANCKTRPWEPHKFSSEQEQEANLAPLLAWVADYYTREGDMSLQAHRACFAGYGGDKREVTSMPSLSPLEPRLLEWLREA
ncbi:shikimate kinase [Prosthecobacter sp.]|jgi:adenylate kinase family enzyme|uniref:shikimate kinase n=1 Tax=Prosthecobacter sp. TaxID=1965333 RepID=UPI003783484F